MESKFEKRLAIYCLYDKETEKFDSYMMAFNDDEAKNHFLDQTAQIAFELASKADTVNYNRLFSSLKTTCFMRLATFDDVTGVFTNEKIVLLDNITDDAIENYIKLKFDLKNKFMDLVPNKEKKEGSN